MSWKKPAPDLIRGGHRFSDKDMRKRSAASPLPSDEARNRSGSSWAGRYYRLRMQDTGRGDAGCRHAKVTIADRPGTTRPDPFMRTIVPYRAAVVLPITEVWTRRRKVSE